jgi:protein-tyrosine phosphatase
VYSVEMELAERRNFRDVATLPMLDTDGKSLLCLGKIYRMGKLYKLAPEEVDYIEKLGITDIFDLRSDNERRAEPDAEIPSARMHHLDFSGGLLGLEHVMDLYRKAAENPSDIDGEAYILESYRKIPEICSDQVRTAVELITNAENPRVLIHCAGGKDRTGFLIAVLLGSVGISEELILQDYMCSKRSKNTDDQVLKRYLKRFAAYGIDVPPEVAKPFLTVDKRALAGVLDQIKSRYGCVNQYLQDAAGLPKWRISRLQEWLIC